MLECISYNFFFSHGLDIIETLDPEVRILSLAIKSPGRSDIFLPIPEDGKPGGPWFALKEGSRYSLEFTFQVNNNIVSGLKYTNTVWKTGIKGTLSLPFPNTVAQNVKAVDALI